jgi:hypothetical protein
MRDTGATSTETARSLTVAPFDCSAACEEMAHLLLTIRSVWRKIASFVRYRHAVSKKPLSKVGNYLTAKTIRRIKLLAGFQVASEVVLS